MFFEYLLAWPLMVYPLWRICRRMGRDPALALISIVPYVGLMALALALAIGRWPSIDSVAGERPGR